LREASAGSCKVISLSKSPNRKDKRGFDLISDVLPFRRLWFDGPNAVMKTIGYAEHYNRSHDAVIRVHDDAGNKVETHKHAGAFKEP
jgi:hypothetical protein